MILFHKTFLSPTGVIRGISPTEDISPHHFADVASRAILCVPRINESDTESRQVLRRKLSITVTFRIITHKQGHGGGVRQNISVTHSVINQLTDILTKVPSSNREEWCLLKCDVMDTCYRRADKVLARPGWKQATATEDFDFHIYLEIKMLLSPYLLVTSYVETAF